MRGERVADMVQMSKAESESGYHNQKLKATKYCTIIVNECHTVFNTFHFPMFIFLLTAQLQREQGLYLIKPLILHTSSVVLINTG